MKKIIFVFIGILLLGLGASTLLYGGNENIRFLSNSEVDDSSSKKCWDEIKVCDGKEIRYCGNCEMVPGTNPWYKTAKKCL